VAKSVTYRNIQETTDLEQNGLRPLTLRREQESKAGDIAIIGLSGRYPKARTTEEFWENLKNGLDCISEIPEDRWDYKKFFDAEKRTPGKIYSKWGGFIDDVDKFDPLFSIFHPEKLKLWTLRKDCSLKRSGTHLRIQDTARVLLKRLSEAM
jgi:polyketide synthase PksN